LSWRFAFPLPLRDSMALFGGKGLPTSALVLIGAFWMWEVITLHGPQIAAGYPDDTYSVAKGVIVKRQNPSLWLVGHAATAGVVLFMWLLQASKEVRTWSYTFHRWNGRLSLLLWLPFGIYTPIAAFSMSQTEKEMNIITRGIISLFGVLVVGWIILGWVAIARWKDSGWHRQCMIRALAGSISFSMAARTTFYVYKTYIRDTAWWWDELVWITAALSGGGIEAIAYLMEKSFETPWEFRLLGLIKVWDAPEEEEKAVQMAPAEEHS